MNSNDYVNLKNYISTPNSFLARYEIMNVLAIGDGCNAASNMIKSCGTG